MKRFFLFFLLWQSAAALAAEGELFSKADIAFRGGHFEEARDLYSKIAQESSGQPAALFYNYGTVLMKTGDVGQAYAYFLRALALDPFDGDIRNNLDFVRTQLSPGARSIAPAGFFSGLVQESIYLPQGFWLTLTLGCFTLFLVFFLSQRGPRFFRWITLFLACVFGAATLVYTLAPADRLAVVSLKDAKLRSGPSQGFPEIVGLESGSLVRIEENREGWAKIGFLLKNERNREIVGWMETKFLLPISSGELPLDAKPRNP